MQVVAPPGRSWRWAQHWHELLFAHWQVSGQALRSHLPPGLEVDTYGGTAWVSVVAFRLHVRRRWLPPLAGCGHFLELNLRTYVRWRDEPGICFLSIHAGRRLAVGLARWLTPLPYVFARIGYQRSGASWRFDCRGAGAGLPLFDAEFTPAAGSTEPDGDSLDRWLLDRYRAFVADRRGRLYRMVVQHAPWSVQGAAVHLRANRLGAAWGLDLDGEPEVAHFSPGMPALVWPFESIT
jgi:uncharacterized protein YqjF (DUF2071 family)